MLSTSESEGVLVGGRLERTMNQLGEPAIASIFGGNPDILAKAKRFVKLVDTLSLRPSLTKPASAQAATLLGFGQASLAATALGSGMVAGIMGSPSGALMALGGGSGIVLGPAVMARLMTRPGVTELMTKALKTPVTGTAGTNLLTKLTTAIGAEMSKTPVDVRGAAHKYLSPPSEAKPERGGASIGERLNNPGNLKTPSGEIKRFGSLEEGWQGLQDYLQRANAGKHARYRPEMSLEDFFKVYAPKSDNNNPEAYAGIVAERLGVPVSTPIRDLVGRIPEWATEINRVEWGPSGG